MLGRSYLGALERHKIIVRAGVQKNIDHSGVRCTRGLEPGAIGETGRSFRQQGEGVRARRTNPKELSGKVGVA